MSTIASSILIKKKIIDLLKFFEELVCIYFVYIYYDNNYNVLNNHCHNRLFNYTYLYICDTITIYIIILCAMNITNNNININMIKI